MIERHETARSAEIPDEHCGRVETAEPSVNRLNRSVSVVGMAAREAGAKRETPGNGAATA
jgi:hypothetical protein